MTRAYSDDLRQRCVNAMASGIPASKVATQYGVAKSSVIKWHQRFRETGSVSPAKMGGYRRHLLEPYRDLLLGELDRTPHITIDQLQLILQQYGVSVCRDTVWRFVRRAGKTFKKNTIRD